MTAVAHARAASGGDRQTRRSTVTTLPSTDALVSFGKNFKQAQRKQVRTLARTAALEISRAHQQYAQKVLPE